MTVSHGQNKYQIRAVRREDSSLLQQYLWQTMTLTQVEQRIERAQKLTTQERGGGFVVQGHPDQPAIIAYGQLTRWTNCAEISDLIVHPAYRNQGLGTLLIRRLVEKTRMMGLSCVEIGAAESNPRAMALYQRLGFEDAYQVKVNLGNGEEIVTYLRMKIR